MVVKGGEQRDAETAIRHRIKQAVARGREEEVQPQRQRGHRDDSVPEPEHDDGERQKSTKNKRMREPSMSPEVPVSNPEAKPNHIEVWDNGTRCSDYPNTFWNLRLVETGSDAKGCHYMRG